MLLDKAFFLFLKTSAANKDFQVFDQYRLDNSNQLFSEVQDTVKKYINAYLKQFLPSDRQKMAKRLRDFASTTCNWDTLFDGG